MGVSQIERENNLSVQQHKCAQKEFTRVALQKPCSGLPLSRQNGLLCPVAFMFSFCEIPSCSFVQFGLIYSQEYCFLCGSLLYCRWPLSQIPVCSYDEQCCVL